MASTSTSSNVRTPFHRNFYIANTMEIFERLAWYGFFTVSSLYMTGPKEQGGLGFTDQERGFLQGMIPFMLYLLPVVTGALADRYGYRRMFLISFSIMAPSYYLLGKAHDFYSFFIVFLAVAIGAACFKPVVVGTVARTTDDTNRGLGFGIFYTMVNIGGFLGPLVAGFFRDKSWEWVFSMSALWILLNFIPTLFFYRETPAPAGAAATQRSLAAVLTEARSVLGNGRLALLVVPLIIGIMLAAKGAWTYQSYLLGAFVWLAVNVLWSALLAKQGASKSSSHHAEIHATSQTSTPWYKQAIQVGNTRFVVYLLILTGFWTVYFQIFLTAPLYLRDFVDTSDLVRFLAQFAPNTLDFLASVNPEQIQALLPKLAEQYHLQANAHQLEQLRLELANYKILLPVDELGKGLQALYDGHISVQTLSHQWIQSYRQVNPEYIINIDFAAIVLLQIGISHFIQRWRALPILVSGTVMLALSMAVCGFAVSFAVSGLVAVLAVFLFALGEMVASPKSQEYVAAFAPPEQSAMFMGYYFVSMALGTLFGGLLSGWAYGEIAKKMHQPMLMWLLFAGIGLLTALALWLFDRHVRKHVAASQ